MIRRLQRLSNSCIPVNGGDLLELQEGFEVEFCGDSISCYVYEQTFFTKAKKVCYTLRRGSVNIEITYFDSLTSLKSIRARVMTPRNKLSSDVDYIYSRLAYALEFLQRVDY